MMPHRHYLLLVLLFVAAGNFADAQTPAAIEAGIATVDITPPIGGQTTGYANSPPTDGVHDPISARVLVLQSGQTKIALVVVDACVFNSSWIHAQADELGLDRVLFMNTHTHSGPSFRQADFPSPDEPWQKTVEKRILDAIKKAQASMFDAYFSASEGRLQLGYNRLVHIREGRFAETHFENPDRIPYGAVDPTVGVICITDDQRTVRAVLVHYACHPVVLGPRNSKISADYPGVTRKLVEEQFGNGAVCFFIQGAGGDINPLIMARGDSRDGDFELVDRMGRLLATEVLKVVKSLESKQAASDQLLSASTQLSVANRWNRDESVDLGVTTVLINDDIGVITMPGEPFIHFQVDFRHRAGVKHAFVFGYCCDGPYRWPSYLPDVVSAARGGYGASDTTKAEVGGGERLVNAGLAQLFKLQGRLKSAPQRHSFDR